MNLGGALDALKDGLKVNRSNWNGKDQFLFLAYDIEFETEADLNCVSHLEGDLTGETIVLKTTNEKFIVGWTPSPTDLLATDWEIVE